MDTPGWKRAIDNTCYSAMLLKTESNRRIAVRAKKQKTRIMKFCVALEMYGLPDEGDEMATKVLKMARKFYYYEPTELSGRTLFLKGMGSEARGFRVWLARASQRTKVQDRPGILACGSGLEEAERIVFDTYEEVHKMVLRDQ